MSDMMPAEQKKALDELGFVWEPLVTSSVAATDKNDGDGSFSAAEEKEHNDEKQPAVGDEAGQTEMV